MAEYVFMPKKLVMGYLTDNSLRIFIGAWVSEAMWHKGEKQGII